MTEDTFLRELFPRLGPMPPEVVLPPGDDCAAVRVAPGRLLLLAVDQVVAERHFRRRGPGAATPEEAGRKLMARNLSDIAAMGGRPLYALVATAAGPAEDVAWLARFLNGVTDLGRACGTVVIGGDLARTPTDTVASLTIVGEIEEGRLCRRDGARPGDRLLATGTFGDSLGSGHHLQFVPRLREGQWLAARGCVHAMIDVSDGLLRDAGRLCTASGVGLRLDPAGVPRRTPHTTLASALADGEDYELLVAVPAAAAAALPQAWPFPDVPLSTLGEFVAGPPEIRDGTGRRLDEDGLATGFDHFAGEGTRHA